MKQRKLWLGAAVLVVVFSFSLLGAPWAAEKKTVRIWHTETEPQSVAAFQQIINDFEKLNPDITVKQEALAWGDLEAKLTAALAAGAPPDATHGQAVTCASFYAKGLLRDQEDIAASIGRDNIWEAVRLQCFHDGKYYGIPHSAATSLLIYRKDIFKAKGLKQPETWDDFIKVAEAMMEKDKDGRVTRYGLSLPGVGLFINIAVGELTKPTAEGFSTRRRAGPLSPKNRLLKCWISTRDSAPRCFLRAGWGTATWTPSPIWPRARRPSSTRVTAGERASSRDTRPRGCPTPTISACC
jgi:ABC-type glycerol-3-phosphate transport system substrate-binding protein